jgi:hypothetical protein
VNNPETSPAVEPGQEYERHDPRENVTIRIRVVGMDDLDDTRVRVATVVPYGYLIRFRSIAVRQLHDNPRRKTGYRLVQHADGTPAEGVR